MFEQLDVSSFSNGELVVEGGDLKTSTTTESLLNCINFCLLTSLGDYKPKLDFGASPERFVGKPNNITTRNFIKMHLDYHIRNQGILTPIDYALEVIPVSNEEIAVIMKINLSVVEFDPRVAPKETIIAYKYDFSNGTLEKVT